MRPTELKEGESGWARSRVGGANIGWVGLIQNPPPSYKRGLVHMDPQTEPGEPRAGRWYAGSQGGGPVAEWNGRPGNPTTAHRSQKNQPNTISPSPSRPIIGPHLHANRAKHAGLMAEQAVMTRGRLRTEDGVTVQGPGRKPMEDDPSSTGHSPEDRTVGPTHSQVKQRAPVPQPSTQLAKGRTGDCPGPKCHTWGGGEA